MQSSDEFRRENAVPCPGRKGAQATSKRQTRIRALAPPTICIAMPTVHPAMIR